MTLQTIQPGLYIPPVFPFHQDLVINDRVINASGEKYAFVFRAAKTGTIDTIGFRTRNVVTAQTLRISLQLVDATVQPAQPYIPEQLHTTGAETTLASPAANTYYTVTLGTGCSVTRGDLIAVVIEFDSTVGDVGFAGWSNQTGGSWSFPYTLSYTTAWAALSDIAAIAIGYSDSTFEHVFSYPMDTVTTTNYNSSSTPDELALRFSLPFPCRVAGFWHSNDIDAACDVVLYQGTTAQETLSLDSDVRGSTTNRIQHLYFDTAVSITKGTEYFLSFKPTSASSIKVYYFTCSSAAMMDGFPGGTDFYWGERTDAGAWTTTTTKRPLWGLIIDQFDDATGGGGGMLVHPGMSGGARG